MTQAVAWVSSGEVPPAGVRLSPFGSLNGVHVERAPATGHERLRLMAALYEAFDPVLVAGHYATDSAPQLAKVLRRVAGHCQISLRFRCPDPTPAMRDRPGSAYLRRITARRQRAEALIDSAAAVLAPVGHLAPDQCLRACLRPGGVDLHMMAPRSAAAGVMRDLAARLEQSRPPGLDRVVVTGPWPPNADIWSGQGDRV